MIGRTVSHYRILSPLGSGGMGVVYLAEDARLGRRVALKFLPASWAQETKALERFRVEARAASSLSHPSICAIYDIGQDGDTPFIVMEALKGETLRERISKGAMRVADVLDIGIQLADALGAAHAQGIVHRDIKPANIFLGDKNRVKVLDFGLAKLTTLPSSRSGTENTTSPGEPYPDIQITQPGTALGTVSYMSPEQARGEEIDSRSDLFSLGAVLYEMVTGNQAFSGGTTAVIYDAILNRAPRPIADLNTMVPPRLEAVIATALEKDRDLRCQHATDLEAEMKRIRRDLDSGSLATSRTVILSSREMTPPSGRSVSQPAVEVTRRWDKTTVVIAVLAAVIAAALIWRGATLPWRGQSTAGDRAAASVAEEPATSIPPSAPVTSPAPAPPPIEAAPAPVPAPAPAPAPDSHAVPAPAKPGAAPARSRATTPQEPAPTPRSALPEPPAAVATPPPPVASLPATPPATANPAAQEVKQQPAPAEAPAPAPPPPAPVQPATPPPRAVAAPEPSPPAASPVETDEAAIRRVIRIYKQAIETKNIALYRSVRPNLSRSAETVLMNSFKQVDSQEIDIRVEGLEIDGRRASARLVRRDTLTIAGRRQIQNITQTLRFEKTEAGWIIAE